MSRPHLSQILVGKTNLKATKLQASSRSIKDSIEATRRQQEDVLRLKEVDRNQLKTVIQL